MKVKRGLLYLTWCETTKNDIYSLLVSCEDGWKHLRVQIKVVWYPKTDQKVCLNMVKQDQLCGIALKKRK